MSESACLGTTCPYCGVGCGVMAEPQGDGLSPVAGDSNHPANKGRLCVKGSALHETLGQRGRLMSPRIAGAETDWETAIATVATRLQAVRQRAGAHAIAFYLSGQLLTEDYYVANKLAKGFIGTPHVDTNSRLCMSSAVAAYKRAFGEDVVPGCYDDLELADLLVFAGANPAWNHPVLYQRMQAVGKEKPGRRVVVIDPRRTASCELADLHLALKPGTDAILWNGLLVWLAQAQALDHDWLQTHCSGFGEALKAASAGAPDTASVADQCDLEEADVRTFYQWFAQTPRTVSFWSQGINQSSSGTDKGNAIINAHLATGRVGKPGASPFSITGQPNAMGGREVGGLANQLAAHLDYDTPGAVKVVEAFWKAPAMVSNPGYKAVELIEAIERGEIQALWIMATNPLVSLPDSNRVSAALARCPLVIVSDCVSDTDTIALADIVLPAQGWSEKDGTVTNSERCISRQRGLLPAVGEARPDWWIMSRVAAAMGYGEAFDYAGPADIFREHAALSACHRRDSLRFNLEALASLSDQAYEQLRPVQWPVTSDCPHGCARLYGDGQFSTPDRRARLMPIKPRLPVELPERKWPVMISSGRIRDQWHTMTRTGRAARLLQHHAEPFIAMHPDHGRDQGLEDGDLAWLHNGRGRYLGRVRHDGGQRYGEVFIPIHWNDQFATDAVAARLFPPVTDPVSGQPESKQTSGCLVPYPALWQARFLVRGDPELSVHQGFQVRVPLEHCLCWHLAGTTAPDWNWRATEWFGRMPDVEMRDSGCTRYRAAWYESGRLAGVLMVEPGNDFPSLQWLDGLFSASALDEPQRRQVLAGQAADVPDTGTIVCSCYQVGERTIEAAISEGCTSVEVLGNTLKCGTNCGSCVPELRGMLTRHL